MSLGTQLVPCVAIGPHAHATHASKVDAMIPSITPCDPKFANSTAPREAGTNRRTSLGFSSSLRPKRVNTEVLRFGPTGIMT